MRRTFADEFRKRIRRYTRQIENMNEFLAWSCRAAARPEYFAYIDSLPVEVLSRLRELTEKAPAHPEDAKFPFTTVGVIEFMLPEEADARDAQQRLEYYWASRRLRQHFFPQSELPEFDVEKCIGVVEEICRVEGEMVLFGDFQQDLIRKNPTYCRYQGKSHPLRFVEQEWTVNKKTELYVTYEARALPTNGLVLQEESTNSDALAVGAELWVDRSAVREIPELVYDEYYD